MKKLLCVSLCVLLAALLSVGSFAGSGKNLGKVPGSSTALTLDGKKDAVYSSALKLNGSLSQDGKSAVKAKADYYVLYTADALWIFCEITDSTLVTKAADPKQPTFKVDSIEIMLDLVNKGEDTPDATPLQCRIDHNNLVSARKGSKGTSLFLRKSEGGTVDFFEAQAVKTTGGFNAEFKIPTNGLKSGSTIGVNFCYNDWDKDDGARVVLGTTANVTSWKAAEYENVTLGDYIVVQTTAKATAAATTAKAAASTAKAAQTFDSSVLLVLPALVSGAAAFALSRKRGK